MVLSSLPLCSPPTNAANATSGTNAANVTDATCVFVFWLVVVMGLERESAHSLRLSLSECFSLLTLALSLSLLCHQTWRLNKVLHYTVVEVVRVRVFIFAEKNSDSCAALVSHSVSPSLIFFLYFTLSLFLFVLRAQPTPNGDVER